MNDWQLLGQYAATDSFVTCARWASIIASLAGLAILAPGFTPLKPVPEGAAATQQPTANLTASAHPLGTNRSLISSAVPSEPTANTGTTAMWLYTQRGTGYGVKNVGLVVNDFEGNLIVVGRARDLTNLTGHYQPPPATVAAADDLVWAKFAPDERPLRFVKLGEADAPRFGQLVADPEGNIHGVAWLKEDTRLFTASGVRHYPKANGQQILLLKWTPDGQLVSAYPLTGKGRMYGTSLAVKPDGTILVAGDFETQLDLPGRSGPVTLLSSNRSSDFFVAEFSQDGHCIWARQISDAEASLPASIAADQDGNCFLTGGFESRLRFADAPDAPVLGARGGSDCFLAKYDPQGRLLWVRQSGGPSPDYGTSVKWDQAGCCYLFGRFGKDAWFGEGDSVMRLECRDRADMFMACYTADGELLGAIRVGGSGIKLDAQWTIVMDELGNRYVVGGNKQEIQRWPKPRLASASSPATVPPASAPSGTAAVMARAVPPSRFESIGRGQEGSIQIVLEGHPEALYVIEASVDLNTWIPVSTNRVLGGQLLIEDPAAAGVPVRFFRVRQPSGGNLE